MKLNSNFIEIPKVFDAHCHFRQGGLLTNVLPFSSEFCKYAVAMGNTQGPIECGEDVEKYRNNILQYSHNKSFKPIMTVMLTRGMTPEKLEIAYAAGAKVLKWIPGGASTNSSDGVPLWDIEKYYPALETARRLGMVFAVHWELTHDHMTGEEIPELEREERAIPYFKMVTRDFVGLKITVEHVTTSSLIQAVKDAPGRVAGTITAHHIFLTMEDVIDPEGYIVNPLNYCKPIAKTEKDRDAIRGVVLSGDEKFFFGSDSAPHLSWSKKGFSPAAGIFSAPVMIPLLVHFFDDCGRFDLLPNFTSGFAGDFYELPGSEDKIKLHKQEWTIPDNFEGIPIFMGGQQLNWRFY